MGMAKGISMEELVAMGIETKYCAECNGSLRIKTRDGIVLNRYIFENIEDGFIALVHAKCKSKVRGKRYKEIKKKIGVLCESK